MIVYSNQVTRIILRSHILQYEDLKSNLKGNAIPDAPIFQLNIRYRTSKVEEF